MAAKTGTKAILDDAGKVLPVWKAHEAEIKLKDATRADTQTLLDDVTTLNDEAETLQRQLSDVINRRDDKAKILQGNITRARGGIRSYFGPDSSEYELAGGTRSSERKPRKPRTTTPK